VSPRCPSVSHPHAVSPCHVSTLSLCVTSPRRVPMSRLHVVPLRHVPVCHIRVPGPCPHVVPLHHGPEPSSCHHSSSSLVPRPRAISVPHPHAMSPGHLHVILQRRVPVSHPGAISVPRPRVTSRCHLRAASPCHILVPSLRRPATSPLCRVPTLSLHATSPRWVSTLSPLSHVSVPCPHDTSPCGLCATSPRCVTVPSPCHVPRHTSALSPPGHVPASHLCAMSPCHLRATSLCHTSAPCHLHATCLSHLRCVTVPSPCHIPCHIPLPCHRAISMPCPTSHLCCVTVPSPCHISVPCHRAISVLRASVTPPCHLIVPPCHIPRVPTDHPPSHHVPVPPPGPCPRATSVCRVPKSRLCVTPQRVTASCHGLVPRPRAFPCQRPTAGSCPHSCPHLGTPRQGWGRGQRPPRGTAPSLEAKRLLALGKLRQGPPWGGHRGDTGVPLPQHYRGGGRDIRRGRTGTHWDVMGQTGIQEDTCRDIPVRTGDVLGSTGTHWDRPRCATTHQDTPRDTPGHVGTRRDTLGHAVTRLDTP